MMKFNRKHRKTNPHFYVFRKLGTIKISLTHANWMAILVSTLIILKKNKRGISIFVCEKIVGTKIVNLSICNDEVQSCAVKVQLSHEFLFIFYIYGPHSGTVSNFIETLESFYEHPDFLNCRTVFIAGDFNINI